MITDSMVFTESGSLSRDAFLGVMQTEGLLQCWGTVVILVLRFINNRFVDFLTKICTAMVQIIYLLALKNIQNHGSKPV